MVLWDSAPEAAAARLAVSPQGYAGHVGGGGLLRHTVGNAAAWRLPSQAAAAFDFLQRVQPMSPALGCVVSLTVLFFGVYLVAVLARLVRVVAGFAVEKHLQPSPVERAIVSATDALALAPMLCVLMISVRLRAMELGMPAGDPPSWVQMCMYALTAAFLGRFLLDMLSVGVRAGECGPQYWLLRGAYGVASLVLYGGCAAIAAGIVSLRAGHGGPTPRLSVMMQCMTVLAVAYIAECLAVECLRVAGSIRADARRRRALAGRAGRSEAEDGEGTAGSVEGSGILGRIGSADDIYKLVKSLAEEEHRTEVREHPATDSVLLQFPLMLCVLLVGMSLRAVQLRLQPGWWACIAMYVTTFAIVSWAVLGMLMLSGCSMPAPAAQSCLQRLGLAADAPAGPGAAAGHPRACGSASACLSGGWVLLVAAVYLGTALVVASVFAMEAQPMSDAWPGAAHAAAFYWASAASRRAASAAPATSTAMRCVMILTVLYFGVHLCLMAGRVARGAASRWAASVVEGLQRALAFAPMLCVMMIAVRMRAMQLGIRDPQPWAQAAMLTAAVAVAVQVACSLFPTAADDPGGGGGGLLADTVVGKVLSISALALRHSAAAASYVATAALIAALLFMDPGS